MFGNYSSYPAHPTPTGEIMRTLTVGPPRSELSRLVEQLTNLLYLMRQDVHDPAKIYCYVDFAEQAVARLRNLAYENERQRLN